MLWSGNWRPSGTALPESAGPSLRQGVTCYHGGQTGSTPTQGDAPLLFLQVQALLEASCSQMQHLQHISAHLPSHLPASVSGSQQGLRQTDAAHATPQPQTSDGKENCHSNVLAPEAAERRKRKEAPRRSGSTLHRLCLPARLLAQPAPAWVMCLKSLACLQSRGRSLRHCQLDVHRLGLCASSTRLPAHCLPTWHSCAPCFVVPAGMCLRAS